jgi:serine/threonine protein kinase
VFKPEEMIGPYRLVRRIGKGAFGVVWLAEKRSALATTTVAIKIPAEDTVDIEAVKREASVWVSASGHPNVLPIIDAEVYGDHVVIVSEYAPDGTLADWLERHGGRAPSTEEAVDIMVGILAGLDHLHRRGIIHRDLKPENILLQGETPRLADFGIARVLKGTSHTAAASGTPVYMPPEAFDGKRAETTDIWSAGVIFYQLLTGRLPFNGEGITALMGSIISKAPPPIADRPAYIWAVIEKALAKDPAERFTSAAEMRRALRQGLVTSAEDATRSFDPDISMHPTVRAARADTDKGLNATVADADSEVGRKTARETRSKWPIWAVLVGLLIAASVVGGLYYFKGGVAGRQHSDEDVSRLLDAKTGSWMTTIFSAEAPNGGLHEISTSEDATQVWSTAQCLMAVLASHRDLAPNADKIKKSLEFIESSRRTSPAPGWNYYGNASPFTVTEIAGWVSLAETYAIDRQNLLSDAERQQLTARVVRDLDEMVQRQDKNGGWRPIRDDQPGFIRTYSSAIALWSLVEARRSPTISQAVGSRYDDNIRRGINWLLLNYKTGQGWVPNPNRPGQTGRFDGLDAHILFILSQAESVPTFAALKFEQAYAGAKKDFIANRDLASRTIGKDNSSVPDVDIRFSGSEFMAEGSTFLWFPWTLAELSQLTRDDSLPAEQRSATTID